MTKYEMRKAKDAKQLEEKISRQAKKLLAELDTHLQHIARKDRRRAQAKLDRKREELEYQRFAKAVHKQCVKCGETKHTEEFPLDPSNNTQRRTCRPCWTKFVESHRK